MQWCCPGEKGGPKDGVFTRRLSARCAGEGFSLMRNIMRQYFSLLASPIKYKTLFLQFVKRDISGRYKGSLIGIAWAFITPLLTLGVYTFVFAGIFKMRWPGDLASGNGAYALRLFAGLVVFNLFSEVVSRASNLIVEQPNLVKKVVFPLELLGHISIGVSLFHFLIGSGMLFVCTILFEPFHYSALLFPLVVMPLIPMLLGVSWMLSAIGVYFRDLGQALVLLVNLLLFLSPVFYSTSTLSPELQFWIGLNPLTQPIENMRNVLFAGLVPDLMSWLGSLLLGLAVAIAGAWMFTKTRDGFADVL